MREVPSDDAAAYRLLEILRWDGAPDTCPHCEVAGRCYFPRPVDGAPRRTRTGARSHRRVWKCGACRRQFSVLTGTVLEGTRVSVATWIAVVDGVVRDGVDDPAVIVARHGVTPETARHMLARLAAALRVGLP